MNELETQLLTAFEQLAKHYEAQMQRLRDDRCSTTRRRISSSAGRSGT